jgi:hypothetical protein
MLLRPKVLLVIFTAATIASSSISAKTTAACPLINQSLEVPDSKRSLTLAIISNTLLFGLPNEHQAKFESLWVDQLAYTSPWRKHVSGTIEELRHMMSWVSSFPLVQYHC